MLKELILSTEVSSPPVSATNGMVGRECLHFLKSLVAMIVEKNIYLTYANVMKDVLQDAEVDQRLLPYQGEDLVGKTANRASEARLDIRAKGFWTRQQEAFLISG